MVTIFQFWYDTVDNEDGKKLLGCQRKDCKSK